MKQIITARSIARARSAKDAAAIYTAILYRIFRIFLSKILNELSKKIRFLKIDDNNSNTSYKNQDPSEYANDADIIRSNMSKRSVSKFSAENPEINNT